MLSTVIGIVMCAVLFALYGLVRSHGCNGHCHGCSNACVLHERPSHHD